MSTSSRLDSAGKDSVSRNTWRLHAEVPLCKWQVELVDAKA